MVHYWIKSKNGKHALVKEWNMWSCSFWKVIETFDTFEKAEEELFKRIKEKCPICTKVS